MTIALDMTDPQTRLLYQLSQQRAALHVQINTGMSMSRGSVLALVRRESTLVPNSMAPLHAGLLAEPGPDGVLVYKANRTDAFTNKLVHAKGDAVYYPITNKGTFIGAFEDLDVRIVELGGRPWDLVKTPITRKGSTDKINAAAERRHERRIAAVQALL